MAYGTDPDSCGAIRRTKSGVVEGVMQQTGS
jgi:hypothetical protein